MQQGGTKLTFVTIENQQEVTRRFRLVPIKSTTLNDFEGSLCTLFALFGKTWTINVYLFIVLIKYD